jgi:hypothetical protein
MFYRFFALLYVIGEFYQDSQGVHVINARQLNQIKAVVSIIPNNLNSQLSILRRTYCLMFRSLSNDHHYEYALYTDTIRLKLRPNPDQICNAVNNLVLSSDKVENLFSYIANGAALLKNRAHKVAVLFTNGVSKEDNTTRINEFVEARKLKLVVVVVEQLINTAMLRTITSCMIRIGSIEFLDEFKRVMASESDCFPRKEKVSH